MQLAPYILPPGQVHPLPPAPKGRATFRPQHDPQNGTPSNLLPLAPTARPSFARRHPRKHGPLSAYFTLSAIGRLSLPPTPSTVRQLTANTITTSSRAEAPQTGKTPLQQGRLVSDVKVRNSQRAFIAKPALPLPIRQTPAPGTAATRQNRRLASQAVITSIAASDT